MSHYTLNIDQSLFGYNDGHRLIASSVKLPPDILSDLTRLSDMAPGALFGDSDGYWTGVPLPSIKVYALMRTWPAPEMSRPGCVWSHALFLKLEALEQIDDLTKLCELVNRPQQPLFDAEYEKNILISSDRLDPLPQGTTHPSDHRTRMLLNAVYGDAKDTSIPASPGELDALIFSIWSQQWPKLRRNFRFQSAVLRDAKPASNNKFDFRLVARGQNLSSSMSETASNIAPWMELAESDLNGSYHNGFRDFLRQYGASVTKPKSSFRPLTEIFSLRANLSKPAATKRILAKVADAFPNNDEAMSLKSDLIEGIGFFNDADLITRLLFLFDSTSAYSFPEPRINNIKRLEIEWSNRGTELVDLAERAIESRHPLANGIFKVISAAIPDDSVWRLLKDHRALCLQLLTNRPVLLVSQNIDLLSCTELVELLKSVPEQASYWKDILPWVLTRDDHQIANLVYNRAPALASKAIVEFIDKRSDRMASPAEPWLKQFRKNSSDALNVQLFATVSRVSTLYEIADSLDWISPITLQAGPKPWLAGLKNANYDLEKENLFIFLSFLTGLAMRQNSPDVAKLFQIAFDPIHKELSRSYLTYKAEAMFISTLPELGMFRNWDTAKRFQIGVVARFIQLGLNRGIFVALSKDRRVVRELKDIALKLPGGKRYLQKKR